MKLTDFFLLAAMVWSGNCLSALGQSAPARGETASTPVAAPGRPSASDTVLAYLILDGEPALESAARPGRIQKSALSRVASQARAAQIAFEQAELSTLLSRSGIQVMARYGRLANALKVRIPAEKLGQLTTLPGVTRVEPVRFYHLATTTSVPYSGAPAVWGPRLPNADGTGVRLGLIDTGIDYTHADFGGTGDPADFASNDPTRVEKGTFPTAKVVGGFDFAGNSYDPASTDSARFTPFPDPDPLDCNGHGSHVAGIAGGLGVLVDGSTYRGSYSADLPFGDFAIGPGVAPNAQLFALKVFGCEGVTDLILEALEWAADPNGDLDLSDRLDVVNLSLGTSFGQVSPDDVVLNAANRLAELGCAVVVAAGNSGNIFYTISAPGVAERAISVANSFDDRFAASALQVLQPRAAAGFYEAVEGAFTAPLSETGPITNTIVYASPSIACEELVNTEPMAGRIALIDRGMCLFTEKILRAQEAGAIAVIMVNNEEGLPFVMGGSDLSVHIPAVMISRADGEVLKSALLSDPRIVLNDQLSLPGSNLADQLSDSSSRGPSSPGSLLKPEIAAPGESILSAASGTGTNSISFSGTSMATPHVAGAAALLRQLHPSWTVEEIKSALMNTARPMRDEQGDLYPESRIGAGRLQVDEAAQTEVTAAAEDGAGLVSLSFGALHLTQPTSQIRYVRLVNHGTNALTFEVTVSPTMARNGAELEALVKQTSIPPRGSVSLPFELHVDPARLDRRTDPTTPLRLDGQPRQTLPETSGQIEFSNSAASIHLPYSAVFQASSDFSVTVTNVGVPRTSDRVNLTIPVRGISAHPGPLTSAFQLGAISPNRHIKDPVLAPADLLAVGAATDVASQGSVENSTLYFGIATAASWTTPQSFLIDVEVLIDTNQDGVIDYVLLNASAGELGTLDLGNPDVANDVFLTVVRDVATGDLLPGGFLNIFGADEHDTAPFDNSVLILSVPAEFLGLSEGSSRFSYRVAARGPDHATLIDQTAWIPFDAARPAVDTAVSGLDGYPVRTNGMPIRVTVDRSAAAVAGGFPETNSLKVLVLHHANLPDRRFQIVQLDLETDDVDDDGIQDSWEIEQFGDLTTATTFSDWDEDGFSDRMEFRAGTHPGNPDSLLRIVLVEPADPGGMELRWTSAPGRTYTVERADSLKSDAFRIVADKVSATPPVNKFIDSRLSGSGPFYYRIKLN